jgi:hypothetical protein
MDPDGDRLPYTRGEAKEDRAVLCAVLGWLLFPPLLVVAVIIGRGKGRGIGIVGLFVWAAVIIIGFARIGSDYREQTDRIEQGKCIWCSGTGSTVSHEHGVRMRCPRCLGSGTFP